MAPTQFKRHDDEDDFFDDFMSKHKAKNQGQQDGVGGTRTAQFEIETAVDAVDSTRPSASTTTPLAEAINRRDYRPDVDGLRAVAVVAVIIFHIDGTWLPGGFVGVDVFFVISGYVVMGSLLRERATTFGAFISNFYMRRVKRLVPALIVVVVATSTLVSWVIPAYIPKLHDYRISGMLALVGWANQRFATLPTGYFDEGGDSLQMNPFTHCWSLGVEEQFYLLFPWLVYLLFGQHAPCMNSCLSVPRAHPRKVLLATLILSAAVSMYLTIFAPMLAYYLLPSRFWQLMSGALLAAVQDGHLQSRVGVSLRTALSVEVVAVLCLGLGLTLTPNDWGFPMPCSLLAICGALCTIACGAFPQHDVAYGVRTPVLNRLLAHPAVVYVGKISYPLYLWHWPTIVLFRWTLKLTSPGRVFCALAIIVVGACFLYHTVEALFRMWRPRRRWLPTALLLTALGAAETLLALQDTVLADGLYLFSAIPGEPPSPPRPSVVRPASSPPKSPPRAPPMPPPTPPPIVPPSAPPLFPAGSAPPPSPPTPPTAPPPPVPPLPPPPFQPAPPAPPPAPACGVRSTNPISVYDALHPGAPSAHDLGLFSNFTSRQCRCRRTVPSPLHTPQSASDELGLAPCFLPTSPSDEPFVRMPNVEDAMASVPCFIGYDPHRSYSAVDVAGVTNTVTRCLTPVRAGGFPRRAVFLIGDSHAAALRPALQVALNGAASFVWSSIGGGCGFVSEGPMENIFRGADKPQGIPSCRAYNRAVDSALEAQLQACDVVVVHHEHHKAEGFDLGDRLLALQTLVKSRGAKLVVIGDTVTLPTRGSYCIATPTSPSAGRACAVDWARDPQGSFGDEAWYERFAQDDSTFFLSLHVFMCNERQMCDANVPGTTTLAYFDRHHLTTAGAVYLWPFLCDFFTRNGLLGS